MSDAESPGAGSPTDPLRARAVEILDGLGTDTLVGPHHLTEIFWVQLLGEGRGILQVAEHNSELTAFRFGGPNGGR